MIAKHTEQLHNLEEIERKRKDIENSLREAGMSEKDIAREGAIRTLRTICTNGREEIRREQEEFAKKEAQIRKKVVETGARANPYRYKRQEFVRIKNKQPIEMEVKKREGADFGEREFSRSYTSDTSDVSDFDEDGWEENESRLQLGQYLNEWNDFVKDVPSSKKKLTIEEREFFQATSGLLSSAEMMDLNSFGNIIKKYLLYKKFSSDIQNVVNNFTQLMKDKMRER